MKPVAHPVHSHKKSMLRVGVRSVSVLGITLALLAGTAFSVLAAVPYETINCAPLEILVAEDGSMQVNYSYSPPISPNGQFYNNGEENADLGIFFWLDGLIYQPDFGSHDDFATYADNTPFTQISQSTVSGNGTSANPWKVTTVLDLGASGVTATQETTCVDGNQYFDITVTISNASGVSKNMTMFHAGDIYLKGSDSGFGYYDASLNAVGGKTPSSDWFVVFMPINPSAATKYQAATYWLIWDNIGSGNVPGPGFNNTINLNRRDNGAGLQWDFSVANGASHTITSRLSFTATDPAQPTVTTPPGEELCGPGDLTNSNNWSVRPKEVLPCVFVAIAKDNGGAGSVPNGIFPLGKMVELTAWTASGNSIHSLGGTVEVCFNYSNADLALVGGNPNGFTIWTSGSANGPWSLLNSTLKTASQEVCAEVDHFSFFELFRGILAPNTGFAPNVVTQLPAPSPEKATTSYRGAVSLQIPELGVDTDIVGVPGSEGGWDVSWLGQDVGYLYGTAFPTWAGNSVLTAHVYDALGRPGPFVNLQHLRWGDQIVVNLYGTDYVYEVRSVSTVTRDSLKTIFQHEKLPWLTLVTCKDFDEATGEYNNRVVVRAVQIAILDN